MSRCAIQGCSEHTGPGSARGMCRRHYYRWKVHGDPNADVPVRHRQQHGCSVDGCGGKSITRGFCSRHYARWKRHGHPTSGRTSPRPPAWKKCPGCGIDIQYKSTRCRACHTTKQQREKLLCAENECGREARANGLCAMHAARIYRKGSRAEKASLKRAERQRWLNEIKLKAGCVDCGYKAHPAALDFDHRDPKLKKMEISRCAGTANKNTLMAEISKCDVRCANCHRIRTHTFISSRLSRS